MNNSEEWPDADLCCDWQDTPKEVINNVNKVLKRLKVGITFKEVNTYGDWYAFDVVDKRKK